MLLTAITVRRATWGILGQTSDESLPAQHALMEIEAAPDRSGMAPPVELVEQNPSLHQVMDRLVQTLVDADVALHSVSLEEMKQRLVEACLRERLS